MMSGCYGNEIEELYRVNTFPIVITLEFYPLTHSHFIWKYQDIIQLRRYASWVFIEKMTFRSGTGAVWSICYLIFICLLDLTQFLMRGNALKTIDMSFKKKHSVSNFFTLFGFCVFIPISFNANQCVRTTIIPFKTGGIKQTQPAICHRRLAFQHDRDSVMHLVLQVNTVSCLQPCDKVSLPVNVGKVLVSPNFHYRQVHLQIVCVERQL